MPKFYKLIYFVRYPSTLHNILFSPVLSSMSLSYNMAYISCF